MNDELNKEAERRKAQRVGIIGSYVQYKVLYASRWTSYQDEVAEPIKNISKGGVCFESQGALPSDALLGLNIKFNEAASPIKMFGRIVWAREKRYNDRKSEVGVIFSWWMKEKDKRELDRFIERHLA